MKRDHDNMETFENYLVYLEKRNPALNWELIKQNKSTMAELKDCFKDKQETGKG